MHIAIVSEHFHKTPSGPRKACLNMATELAAAGHRCNLVGIAPRDNIEQLPGGGEAVLERYSWRLLPTKYGRPRFYARKLERLHRDHPIDAVLAMGLEPGAAALRFRDVSGVPFVLNPRSFIVNSPDSWKFARAQTLARECDAFVALSESAAQAWCDVLGIARADKVFGVLNGVNAAEFEGPLTPPPGLNGEPLILCMGMLREPKGQHVLIKALARMTDLPWQLLLAGDGPARAYLQSLVNELGLSSRVRLAGIVEGAERRWLFRNAQLFALTPVYMEACGNALLEAQAAGLPVVTTDAGSVPEVVEPDTTALVVPVGPVPHPPEAPILPKLEQALRKTLTDSTLRKELGEGGRERAATLSWQQCVNGYMSAFEHALEPAPALS